MDWSDRIGRRLKLRDLHILMAVADTGSMAKAAARLKISHPAVSKAISEIEGTLNVVKCLNERIFHMLNLRPPGGNRDHHSF